MSLTKANQEEKYDRLRCELWCNIKEHLDPRNPQSITIPEDEKLISQLATIAYSITVNGKTKVEGKESMSSRGLSSPDRADALCLAFYNFKPPKFRKDIKPEEPEKIETGEIFIPRISKRRDYSRVMGIPI